MVTPDTSQFTFILQEKYFLELQTLHIPIKKNSITLRTIIFGNFLSSPLISGCKEEIAWHPLTLILNSKPGCLRNASGGWTA